MCLKTSTEKKTLRRKQFNQEVYLSVSSWKILSTGDCYTMLVENVCVSTKYVKQFVKTGASEAGLV